MKEQASDHSKRIQTLETQSALHNERLKTVDAKVNELRVNVSSSMKSMKEYSAGEFKKIHDQLAKSEEKKDKISWLVTAAVLAAIVKFILDGGLSAGIV